MTKKIIVAAPAVGEQTLVTYEWQKVSLASMAERWMAQRWI